MAQLAVLRDVFEEWLRIHEINYDFRFYTPEEWVVKEGPEHFFRGAELMLAFDNALVDWLNLGTSVPDELQDLAVRFGYYDELGHARKMGFYAIENSEPHSSYLLAQRSSIRVRFRCHREYFNFSL